jgi:hypothetical protein
MRWQGYMEEMSRHRIPGRGAWRETQQVERTQRLSVTTVIGWTLIGRFKLGPQRVSFLSNNACPFSLVITLVVPEPKSICCVFFFEIRRCT